MTNMTQSSTIINIKKFFAQNRVSNCGYFVFLNYFKKWFYMVYFNSFHTLAKNTLKIISFQNQFFPRYVFTCCPNFFTKISKTTLPVWAFFVIFSKFDLPFRKTIFGAKFSFPLFNFIKIYLKNPVTNKTIFSYKGFSAMKLNSIFRNTTQRTKFSIFLFSSIGKNLMTEFTLPLRPFFRRMVNAITLKRAKFIFLFLERHCSKLFFTNKTIIKNWIVVPWNRIFLEITKFTTIFPKTFRWDDRKLFPTIQAYLFYPLSITRKVAFLRTIFSTVFSNCRRIYGKCLFAIKTIAFYHGIGIIPSYSCLVKEET